MLLLLHRGFVVLRAGVKFALYILVFQFQLVVLVALFGELVLELFAVGVFLDRHGEPRTAAGPRVRPFMVPGT